MIFQAGSLLLVIIGVYILKHVHIFGERDYKIVQGLVFNLTLPCAIILSFATNKHDMRMLWIVLFGFFACAIPLFIVYFGSRGDEKNYRAFQMLNASGLNLGFRRSWARPPVCRSSCSISATPPWPRPGH